MNYIPKKLAEFASRAMMYEVSCYPSPGLVSPISNGAHKDMNYYTFLNSIGVLNKYMYDFAIVGGKEYDLEDLFIKIREVGIRAEADMFRVTNGVNTHKGMIFLMGITISVLAYGIKYEFGFEKIQELIKAMCKGLSNELKLAKTKPESERSHGENLYVKYNFLGIRGEAENGIPLAFNEGLNAYESAKDLNPNERILQTLITIMSKCEDSTILHRKDKKSLEFVQNISRCLLEQGGIYNEETITKLYELNDVFIEKNISPGGSADILAITILLSLAKDEFFSK
ncbi:MAG: triphosphoribosyl-dephospho-CoA synthase CitG [Sarcina sp.]